MSFETDNISLIRANTTSTAFDSGDVTENTSLAYANLLYPYILDNGGNDEIVSLTIDIFNKEELEEYTDNLPNKKWSNTDRLRNNINNSRDIWGFKETFHGKKKSRAISNAFCFGGQKINFYIAPQGHGNGYFDNLDNQWLYCKTTITITATGITSGTQTVLKTFDDFESSCDDSSRYFDWTVPDIDQTAFDNYGLFGLAVISLDIERTYYSDAEWTELSTTNNPSKNQTHLQCLIYSGAKEIIEVNAGDCNIKTSTPLYTDTLEQIFSKTVFESISNSNSNALTNDQKRAIIADQIAVLFISQHPVITADFYPSSIIGFGANSSIPPRKIIDKAVTYAKRYPDTVPLIKDRLFGMFATYKAFNFVDDIEEIISDFTQSTQVTRDPVRSILIDSENIVASDIGIDGLIFNPYALEVINADVILDVPQSTAINFPLYESLVDIENITITDADGNTLLPNDDHVKISFDVVYGSDQISQIRYVAFSREALNYNYYVDSGGTTRSYTLAFDDVVIPDPSKRGDIVTAQVDIEDIEGGVTSFIKTDDLQGYTVRPTLIDLKIYQRNDGSGIVNVYYTYDGQSEINNAYVYIEFSSNGGVVWSDIPITSLKGDFGDNVMPGRKMVSWSPVVDLSDFNSLILCRITLYDTDDTSAVIDTLTGALVMDLDKPEVAIMKVFDDKTSFRTTISESETYTFSEDLGGIVDFEYIGSNDTTATVILSGESFVVGNVNGYFVWDIDGDDEYTFTFIGEALEVVVDQDIYSVEYNGIGSLLFTIAYADTLSSSSSSSVSSSSSSIDSSSSSSSSSVSSSSSSSLDSSSSSSSSN